MKGRDHKTKQALIEYLQQDTEERFWQAIANFGEEHGLCSHFLTTSWHVPDTSDGVSDLFYQESDSIFKEGE